MARIGLGRLPAALALMAGLYCAPAAAMEGMDMSGSSNTCPLMAGMHEMHFAAWQAGSFDELCMDIPNAGPVTMSIDAVSPEIRDMTTEIRVISGKGPKTADADAVTVFHLPPQRYAAGTATFEVPFTEAGDYTVVVTLRDDHGMEMSGRIPLTVGATLAPWMIVLIVFSLAFVVAVAIYYRSISRRAAAAKAA
jgi:hypothetical protein